MCTIKQIVPTLEDCQRMPAGSFPDSVLVWGINATGQLVVCLRSACEEDRIVCSAPTLEEILTDEFGIDIDYWIYCDKEWNASTMTSEEEFDVTAKTMIEVAIKLWLWRESKGDF